MNLYQQRRDWLLAQIPQDSVVILVGNCEKVRNKNISYLFRQDHDFYYLTGFKEADAVAVLRPNSDKPFVLFNRPNNHALEVSFGERAGQKGAVEYYGADQAHDIAELDAVLPSLLGDRKFLYLSDELGRFHGKVFSWLDSQRKSAKFDQVKVFRELRSILPAIHNRRRIKDDTELALIKTAVKASVEGHKAVMKLAADGINEQVLSAEFFRKISEFGCQDVGYPTILAGGNNACCLHYTDNNQPLKSGELVLIDAGGDYQYYTADITRTFPVNGKFTAVQKQLYQLVLNALDAAIAEVKPAASWHLIYEAAMKVLAKGLIELGILTAPFEEVWNNELYKEFTVHKTGHFMGMDVHDVGSYHDEQGKWITLQENMVFTIEPGLYFPKHCQHIDEKWRGIGIRIEDDILVTANGHENLSAAAPRTIEEIELFMAK